MKKTFWQASLIFLLGVLGLVLSLNAGGTEFIEGHRLLRHPPNLRQRIAQVNTRPSESTPKQASIDDPHGVLNTECKTRPESPRPLTRAELEPVHIQLGLNRFRQSQISALDPNAPKEMIALAHPTNFGWRYRQDAEGRPANQAMIVVLHETVASAQSTLNFFQTPHPNDDDQVSYHTLIDRDGTVIYIVPPDKRAFGAGNSQFNGISVKTNRNLASSVNNFAYHVALVTPPDGRDNRSDHSGYTDAQYTSLAWLLSRTGIPETNITAHRLVDRSGSRSDPRSFDGPRLLQMLRTYQRVVDIPIGCQ